MAKQGDGVVGARQPSHAVRTPHSVLWETSAGILLGVLQMHGNVLDGPTWSVL